MPGPSAELHAAWLWLGGSFALAVLIANVRWLVLNRGRGPVADAVTRLHAVPASGALYQACRLLYYIGLPFAALLVGNDAVTEHYLGLQPLRGPSSETAVGAPAVVDNWVNWAQDAGWAAAAGAVLFVLMLLAWWTVRRALRAADLQEEQPFGRPSGWVQLREAAFHEAHWAFYRNAPLIALRDGAGGNYWGTWIGLGIVGLEALLDPARRRALSLPELAPPALMRVSLALLSALVFWRTQNLWLAVVLHLCISWAMSAIAAATTRAPR